MPNKGNDNKTDSKSNDVKSTQVKKITKKKVAVTKKETLPLELTGYNYKSAITKVGDTNVKYGNISISNDDSGQKLQL